ncbi:mitochondrial carrier domain-containing protein [Cercophora samala]|uniref:Mitochondrial carrier domain-containing protein n=1 Tax=Cercophora samala TaxID=330535 RepID=A0AA39ZNY0_9PEZI|nr:mitochondrial carrier domain-containing protein [Cercophora samala]
MPAELQSAENDHRQRILLQQDGAAHSHHRPPFPIMPPSQQQQQHQQQPHQLNVNQNEATGGNRGTNSSGTTTSSSTTTTSAAKTDPRFATTNQSTPLSSNAIYQRFLKRYRVEVAASASSVLSTLTTFPLDSVKTRMQTYRYNGFVDCVRRTYQTEKFRGFFRGVTAPMASITLVRTISFSIYQRSKYAYSDWVKRHFGVDVMAQVAQQGSYPNFWSVATFGAAGMTAGSCITAIACPFELTKLSAQVSVLIADKKNCPKPESHAIAASYQNKGTLKTMGNIIKHRGIGGLYTGFRLHLLRDTLGTGTYFMTYESSKQLLTTFGGDGTHSNPLAVLVAGGLCGIVSWALIYPVDSAKSIYQRNSLMYSKGQKVEPVKIAFFQRNMYRGLGVSMGRSCAVNAVFFSSFEFLKKRIKAMDEQNQQL